VLIAGRTVKRLRQKQKKKKRKENQNGTVKRLLQHCVQKVKIRAR